MRGRGEAVGGHAGEREGLPRTVDPDRAEERRRTLLDLVRQAPPRRGPRAAATSSGRSTQTRLDRAAGQRHQRERAGLGVEFGRGVVVGKRVGEVHDQRGLVVAPFADADADAVADGRAAAVGGDDEAGRGRFARSQIEADRVGDRSDARRRCRRGAGCLGRRHGLKGVDEVGIADVVAEGGEADLAGVEGDLRRADKSPRRVDDAERAQGGLCGEQIPGAEPFQEVDRAGEQGRGALVAAGAGRAI